MAFSITDYKNRELTLAIELSPFQPGRLQSMNLFNTRNVYRTHVDIEYKHNKLSLLYTKERGSRQGTQITTGKRSIKSFKIPHIPAYATIRPDDLPDVRALGTVDGKAAMNVVVAEYLEDMRQDMETTIEFHMMGAVNGLVTEPDGTEILDLFDIFGITQETIDINTSADDLMLKIAELERLVQDLLGADTYTGLHVMCGDTLFDNLLRMQEVKDAYNRPNNGQFLRDSHTRQHFEFGNVVFENYRGSVGAVDFIPATKGRVIPRGVKNLFIRRNGPADTMDAVGKMGKPYVVTKEEFPHDAGWEFKGQVNPLIIPTRPQVLVEITDTTP